MQAAYVGFSALIFWLLLGPAAAARSDMFEIALLSTVYLAVLTLLFMWVVPAKYRAYFARRLAPVEKLGVIFNYFTFLLLLQIAMRTWKERAELLAALFAISWVAFFTLLTWIYPVWNQMGRTFFSDSNDGSPFDATGRQSRRTEYDRR